MAKKAKSDKEILLVLLEAESGTAVLEVCRQ